MASAAAGLRSFANEPLTDFRNPDNAQAMRAAIAQARADLGREYDLVIGGRRIRTSEKIQSFNPAHPSEIVGLHQKAGREQVEPAMQAALQAFESWKRASAERRAETIFRLAAILRRRKLEFNAWIVLEAGKNWDEAEADTCEAIDFCELYARAALHLTEAEPLVQLPGERDSLQYIPLGAGVVIAPWNFPLAILCGMTVASIVSGNTVIVKPSSDSPTVAAKFFEALEEVGLPAGVANFCPGSGAAFGRAIVDHPKTRFIAFTGSREIGLEIHLRAAHTQPGQIWIKRTILEMGGKDAIIVAGDSNLDAAVEGVAVSAFGFQGQKCSACSRAIVDETVYGPFVEKLKERVSRIQLGDPAENLPMGPVINERAMRSILQYIGVGQREGRLVCGGKRAAGEGYFIEPTLFADVAPGARLAQEEIFGPVLAVIPARDFDYALQIANNTEYGLTGAVYTRSLENIDRAKQDFHVGNLYINRKCTGAVVGAHPFGGFNMSGTDSKAGGPDYLCLFTQAKSIGERIHG
ncbi:MAG TPA: L-glutamate gamma-semialdehyde dehydrogenase [Bryobacteraceae bacterium]|nr:L-glutamate gamma-semialdehyde dehydrogenase [Bryobacteraceae bacterium]